MSGVSEGGGRGPGGTMEVLMLTICFHEGNPPADDIFVHSGCAQPVPSRSPCPGPGPAEATRAAASAGRAARRGDRCGDRGVEVVRRDRAVGRRCRPGALAVLGAARGPAEESTFRRAFALVSGDVLDRVLGAWLWTRAVQAAAGWSSLSTARPSAARGIRPGRPRTWSRPSRTGSARSSARSPWTRNRMRSPRCGSC